MRGKRLKLASFGFVAVLLTVPVFAAGSLHVTSMKEQTDIPGLKYSCAYPRLSGIQDSVKQQQLNVRFKEMAMTAKQAAQYAAKKTPGASISGSYDFSVKRNKSGILSMKLTETLTGNGRSETTCKGITVNTVSGTAYQLGDLFFDDADFVSMISDNVQKQISLRGLDKKMPRGFTKIRKSESFYLTNEDLVILLRQSSSPRDMAVQEFTIKLKSLEGSLKPSLRLST
jgi:hypothetical protein